MNIKQTLTVTLLLSGLLLGVAFAENTQSDNKQIVKDFYETVFNHRDIEKGIDLYMGKTYTQHNPFVGDGVDGFRQGIEYYLGTLRPNAQFEVVRANAEDDLVYLHVRVVEAGKPDTAIIDIFRLANGRLVEHWDVAQEVPAEQAHGNTMF